MALKKNKRSFTLKRLQSKDMPQVGVTEVQTN